MNDNEFKIFSRSRRLIEVMVEEASKKIDGTVMVEIREHLIQMRQIENRHSRKMKTRQTRCKCKGGATGRTVTADFEYQICDTCGGLFG